MSATRAYEHAAKRALETNRPHHFTLDDLALIAIPVNWATSYAAIHNLDPLPPAPTMVFDDGRSVSFWRNPPGGRQARTLHPAPDGQGAVRFYSQDTGGSPA